MKSLAFVLWSFLLLPFLSSQAPTWLDNPDAKYPGEEWVNALGRGLNESAAREDAMTQIGQYFGVEISTATEGTQNFQSLKENGSESSRLETEVVKKVAVKSSQKLFAVEFSEPFVPRPGETIVAAGVNRKAAYQSWLGLYQGTGKKINDLVSWAKDETRRVILRLAAWKGAEALARLRDDQESKLRLLDPLQPLPPSDFQKSSLLDLREVLGQKTRITVKAEGEQTDRIASLFDSLLTQAGFQTGTGGNLVMSSKFTLTVSRSGYGLTAAQWRLDVALKEGEATVQGITLQGKTGGTTAEAAADKAVTEGLKRLEMEFMPQLLTRIGTMVEF